MIDYISLPCACSLPAAKVRYSRCDLLFNSWSWAMLNPRNRWRVWLVTFETHCSLGSNPAIDKPFSCPQEPAVWWRAARRCRTQTRIQRFSLIGLHFIHAYVIMLPSRYMFRQCPLLRWSTWWAWPISGNQCISVLYQLTFATPTLWRVVKISKSHRYAVNETNVHLFVPKVVQLFFRALAIDCYEKEHL